MNHRERLLDIANEAIDKLRKQGMSLPWICNASGVSERALNGWRTRTKEPQLATLQAVCMLAGMSLVIDVAQCQPAPRKPNPYRSKVTSKQFLDAACSLGEFTYQELADAVGSSRKAARHWVRRYDDCMVEARREPVDSPWSRVVWRWVGEQVAQPMAAG